MFGQTQRYIINCFYPPWCCSCIGFHLRQYLLSVISKTTIMTRGKNQLLVVLKFKKKFCKWRSQKIKLANYIFFWLKFKKVKQKALLYFSGPWEKYLAKFWWIFEQASGIKRRKYMVYFCFCWQVVPGRVREGTARCVKLG